MEASAYLRHPGDAFRGMRPVTGRVVVWENDSEKGTAVYSQVGDDDFMVKRAEQSIMYECCGFQKAWHI